MLDLHRRRISSRRQATFAKKTQVSKCKRFCKVKDVGKEELDGAALARLVRASFDFLRKIMIEATLCTRTNHQLAQAFNLNPATIQKVAGRASFIAISVAQCEAVIQTTATDKTPVWISLMT
jgi:hypothetical protein